MNALCLSVECNKKERISCDYYLSDFLTTFSCCKKCLKRIVFLLRKGVMCYNLMIIFHQKNHFSWVK